jgi:hypothetical protein
VHPDSLGEPAGWYWDFSPDGQRFLFSIRTDQRVLDPLIVITNWQSTLKK